MKYPHKNNSKKTILVISDLHLGAGKMIKGRRNFLEDFFFDRELVEFLHYYNNGIYENQEVELVINGDFLDLLAVPFINYFDDEFWSEKAAVEKMRMIIRAHRSVMDALIQFVSNEKRKIVYIIGNHDGELVFDSVKEVFFNVFPPEVRHKVILTNEIVEYSPAKNVYIKHGHQYEIAHQFDQELSIVQSANGEKYFVPPWGSYYVTRVVNKFKEERSYINSVKPIKTFMIFGLIFDTFYMIRFILANVYYFLMVRIWQYFKLGKPVKELFNDLYKELELFQDYETLTRKFFQEKPDAKVLIVGHTHEPTYREYEDGTIFVNTGTWTKMVNLDFRKMQQSFALTYAKIEVEDEEQNKILVDLNIWKGSNDLPYMGFYA
jgi:UDP-2,3-diacylglucosamine pyrophosphatase LpxH